MERIGYNRETITIIKKTLICSLSTKITEKGVQKSVSIHVFEFISLAQIIFQHTDLQ